MSSAILLTIATVHVGVAEFIVAGSLATRISPTRAAVICARIYTAARSGLRSSSRWPGLCIAVCAARIFIALIGILTLPIIVVAAGVVRGPLRGSVARLTIDGSLRRIIVYRRCGRC